MGFVVCNPKHNAVSKRESQSLTIHPVNTFSSSKPGQSASASHFQLAGMQRPLAHLNSSLAQVRCSQCAPSSLPSGQSESRSHTHTMGRHFPPDPHWN